MTTTGIDAGEEEFVGTVMLMPPVELVTKVPCETPFTVTVTVAPAMYVNVVVSSRVEDTVAVLPREIVLMTLERIGEGVMLETI